MRTYSELITFQTFEERFVYLRLGGGVGHDTFGHSRWLNQRFYSTNEWKSVRQAVILRDNACDLGIPGQEVASRILVHHMTPITRSDVLNREPCVFDLENLITTRFDTHNAIHYGTSAAEPFSLVERRPGDTKLW